MPSFVVNLITYTIWDWISRLTHTKSNLQFYQKWTASPIHFHVFLWRMVGLLFVATFSWSCESHEWTIGTIKRPCLVWIMCNELGLHRQLASCDINQWFECRAEPQRAIACSLDSICFLSSFNTPILSPLATPPVILLPAQKSCPWQGIISLVHPRSYHTIIQYLKSPYLLIKFCVVKPGFVKSNHNYGALVLW